ncbi:hypothetical protein [Ruegeria sp. Ofav3-42]|uniref:hypothetical protein n=1 Tax=Ruegeria sp. Ofav3-42 TaxID=2917759 RepID=UPI001EF738D5|nr:hypothetical protein [Ruegeria sp. Ofav3-42]MCG7522705.1 hypothetical protein [Ruegeria sp. Ofav3-42]
MLDLRMFCQSSGTSDETIARSLRRGLAGLLYFALLTTVLALTSPVKAEQSFVVGSDRGGFLHDRLIELDNLQRNGVQVEIRGRVCYSTCTMFLGLPGTCVDPDTVFGFHGPSRSGRRLAPKDFDYFSQVMAAYYPEPLRKWFMDKGRNRINGVHKIKGAEIIRMGIPACRRA